MIISRRPSSLRRCGGRRRERMTEALVMLGRLPRATVRPPLPRLSDAEIARIAQTITAAGLTRHGAMPATAE